MIGELHSIVLDTPDLKGLSRFYETVAGVRTSSVDDDWVTTTTPEGWRIAFQEANDHVPPSWPSQERPQQMHLDFIVPDLAAAIAGAERAGATRLDGGGDTFAVLADPSGHPFCLCHRPDAERVRVADVCVDCPDAAALARFYSALLGMKITYEGAEGAMISGDDQPGIVFQNVSGYNPPRWPDPAYPQQLHLDATVADADHAEAKALTLGATRLPGGGETFRVYADPAGHPFCFVW